MSASLEQALDLVQGFAEHTRGNTQALEKIEIALTEMSRQQATLIQQNQQILTNQQELIETNMALKDQIAQLKTDVAANTAATEALVAQDTAGAPDDPDVAAALTELEANNTKLQGLITAPAAPTNSLAVSPANPSVAPGGTQQFTAEVLSNGVAVNPQPAFTWQVSGASGGTIDSNGLYTAGQTAGTDTITVTDGALTAETTVTVS